MEVQVSHQHQSDFLRDTFTPVRNKISFTNFSISNWLITSGATVLSFLLLTIRPQCQLSKSGAPMDSRPSLDPWWQYSYWITNTTIILIKRRYIYCFILRYFLWFSNKLTSSQLVVQRDFRWPFSMLEWTILIRNQANPPQILQTSRSF